MIYKRIEGASDESLTTASRIFEEVLEDCQKQGWALVEGSVATYDSNAVAARFPLAKQPMSSKYMVRGRIQFEPSEETKRILLLRRRALLMELALVEDELGIERSVKRK